MTAGRRRMAGTSYMKNQNVKCKTTMQKSKMLTLADRAIWHIWISNGFRNFTF